MIRRLEIKDINRVIELENSVFNHSLGYEFLEKASKSEIAYVYVDINDNFIDGYISTIFDGKTIEILNFCVDKDYQRQGIGYKLINYVFDELKGKGAKDSILEVRRTNNPAIGLYEKVGYKKIHERKAYYSDGEDALVLQIKF
ncbi:MAG: ribosomal protein S18-alanine N-acetyltransferase [Acholeplasmatales bacterium]|nr:ribosomal protein S18-alanine N-acetyltransferase [Acholeplasmatales bacterium]